MNEAILTEYMVVIKDDAGNWQYRPEFAASFSKAREIQARMAEGTIPEHVVVVYEATVVAASSGRLEE